MELITREQVAGMNIHYLFYSLDYFLDSQVKAGIKTIELWPGVPHFFLDSMTYSDCKIIKKKIESRELQVKILTPENCTYQYQFAAKEPELCEKSFKYFSNAIKVAGELGCEIMAINSGWGYLNEDREEAWKRSSNMLSRLSDVASREGIKLAMESLRPEESQLVITLNDAKRMFDEINHPNLKVMIDTIAMGVAGETIQQWFDVFKNDIIHTHFVDGNPYGHLIWGDGKYDQEGFLKILKDNGYKGYLGQEITEFSYFKDPASHDIRNMTSFERFMFK